MPFCSIGLLIAARPLNSRAEDWDLIRFGTATVQAEGKPDLAELFGNEEAACSISCTSERRGKEANILRRIGLFPLREQDLKTRIGPTSRPNSIPRVELYLRKNQVQRRIWQIKKGLVGSLLKEMGFLLA